MIIQRKECDQITKAILLTDKIRNRVVMSIAYETAFRCLFVINLTAKNTIMYAIKGTIISIPAIQERNTPMPILLFLLPSL